MNIGRKSLSFILAAALMLGVVSVGTGAAAVSTVVQTDAATDYYDAATDYYSGITATGGTQLLGQVHDLIVRTHNKYTSYDDCKTYAPKTDPSLDGRGILEFYTHETMTTGFGSSAGILNREHVWPQSLGNWKTSNAGSDLHHIRPTETRLNGDRGNKKYGEVTGGTPQYSRTTSGANSQLGGYANSSTFMPLDNVKGDVARIVMYVYTHYNTASNVGGTVNSQGSGALTFTRVISASNENAAKQLLIEWNKSDPVDAIEEKRNEEVYKIQGNRNPFIDHPEYASMIWGDGSYDPVDPPVSDEKPTKLTITPSAVTMSVGGTLNLIVSATPSDASTSVKWSVEPKNVVTIADGKLTAYAEGQATVTATSTLDQNVKATATVTVKKSEGGGGSTSADSFTINRDSVETGEGNYAFHDWSAGGVNGIAYIYTGEKKKMQFNSSKDSYYVASTTATPGPITKVTVKMQSGSKSWKLLTSSSPYGEVAKKPTNGNDRGTKTVTTGGVTWEVSGNDTYFALTYEDSSAAYLDSITVEYGPSQGGDPTPHQHVLQYEDADDDRYHLVYCTEGDYDDVEPHEFTEDNGTTCAKCGHHVHDYKWVDKDDASHVWKCKGCGDVTKTEAHTYTDDTDTVCDICGHEREIAPPVHTHTLKYTDLNDEYHTVTCENCGDVNRQELHVYDGEEDTECNLCGHVRTVDTPVHTHTFHYEDNGDTYHTVTCETCGDVNRQELHVYDDEEDTECNLCGHKRTLHTHTPGYQQKDETSHTVTCTQCHETLGTEEHEYTDDSDTTCNKCGYVREVADGKIEAFREAVEDLDRAGTLSERRAALRAAVNAYNALSQSEKNTVREEYAKLLDAIAAYNDDVLAMNEAAKEANDAFVPKNEAGE